MEQERKRIDTLFETQNLSEKEYAALISERNPEDNAYLFEKARLRQKENFGNAIYLRGIIEFSSYCKQNCIYCGLRRDNHRAERYRLSEEEIMECARIGHEWGFRTFVLQSGEDDWYTDEKICHLISRIKQELPDCAVTLSIGEKSREQYQMYYDAGCDRYLLRHETASRDLYQKLHPASQTLENRIRCLYDLKEIGYQVGAGMMLQAPCQTVEDLAKDMVFLKELDPQMIGMGPFIPNHNTPFKDFAAGDLELCLFMIAVLRLAFPKALIPATTALGTIDPNGREKGVQCGANVVMPNLSPREVRAKYMLYDNKICVDDDAVMCSICMTGRLSNIGYQVVKARGDYPGFPIHQPLHFY
jgi:biotin synthase